MKIFKEQNIVPIVKVIVIFMLASFLLGVILASKISVDQNYKIEEVSFFESAFSSFVFNFWLIFLVWLLGRAKGIFLFSYLLVFFKCMLFGVCFLVNLKHGDIFCFLKCFLVDLVLLFPLFGIMLYDIALYNFYKQKQEKPNYKILIYAVWIFAYSLLSGFIRSKI